MRGAGATDDSRSVTRLVGVNAAHKRDLGTRVRLRPDSALNPSRCLSRARSSKFLGVGGSAQIVWNLEPFAARGLARDPPARDKPAWSSEVAGLDRPRTASSVIGVPAC